MVDEERFCEVWNLVFMQFVQDEPYHVVGDLPARSIDTGMGLERVAMLLQGVASVFETDVIWPVLQAGASYSGARYGESPEVDVALRILADHGRSVTMLIADGVVPRTTAEDMSCGGSSAVRCGTHGGSEVKDW